MKKRILALLLAFSLVLSIIPSPAFAEDAAPSESTSICETCGNEVCTCESIVDNCPYCEETTAEDGTVTHAEGCTAAYVYDGTEDVDKYVQLIPEVAAEGIWVSGNHDNDDGIWFYYDEFGEGTIMRITDWYWDASTTALWYCVELYEGSFPESTEDYTWPSTPWILCDYTDTTYQNEAVLEFVTVQPETPGQGGDDGVTDASGQVTVKGSLPADATVEIKNVTDSAILAELGIQGGFAADISVLSNGAVWQPDGTVTITLKVDGNYPIITHYLDDVDAITTGIADGSVMVMDVSGKSAATKALLAAAIAGYQSATNTTDEKVAIEWITNVTDNGDGTISFETDSMSVYTATEEGYYQEITSDTISMQGLVGTNYYITPGTTLTLSLSNAAWWAAFSNLTITEDQDTEWQSVNGSYQEIITRKSYENDAFKLEFYAASIGSATLTIKDTAAVGNYVQVNVVGDATYHAIFHIVERPVTVTFDSNGGTVNPASVTVASGSVITLPVPTAPDGMYFDGWYTDSKCTVRACEVDIKATEAEVYAALAGTGTMPTDLTYSYTVPSTDTTLYARWTDRPEFASGKNFIMIGLINNYYREYENGTKLQYKYEIGTNADGTTKYAYRDSYHQFPVEPAAVAHEDQYRAENSTGSWQIKLDTGNYPLLGSPADYIDPSIFASSQYVGGATPNTTGVFDEYGTGELVNQFLIDGMIDDRAIIHQWLTALKNGTGDVADGVKADIKNSYGIDLDNSTVDAVIDDFKLVPYVLKFHDDRFGEVGWWIIDMIILPTKTYTLSYDMALPAGYTTSAIPPQTEVHVAGDTAAVLDGPPTGYVPTKVVDGQTYTATFLYWTDESGNKYGAGQVNHEILMDSDKVLTAYWSTEDKDPGSMKITKKVTAVAGNQLPSVLPSFDFTYSIDTSTCIEGATNKTGSYSYTVYNAGGIVQSSNTLSLVDNPSGTFQLQNGWYVVMTDLPAGAKVTVKETVVSPYIPQPSELTINIHAAQQTNATFFNAYPLAHYTVEHYLQPDNLSTDYTDYVKQENATQTLIGTVGEPTEAKPNSYDGYTAQPFKQTTVLADDSAVVKIYYNLTPTTGNLTISKTVTGTGAPDEEFSFTVTTPAGTQTVKLKAGQSTTLTSIPAGSFTVTETNLPLGFYTDDVTLSGTIPAGGTATAAFVNEYKPANLTVTKTVTGTDAAQSFSFKVTFGDGSEETFTLANGGSKTFTNIPLDSYKVEELNVPAGYEASSTGATGTAVAGGSYTAAFTNAYAPAQLTITKTVSTGGNYSAPNADFTFKVAFSDNGTYSYTKNGTTTALASGSTLTLKAGESAVFANLPVGITYTVTEQTLPDYFTANQSSFTGTTTRGGEHTASFNNTYTLPSASYTVKYLEQGTSKVLASEKQGEGLVTATVTENAIDITNYTLAGDSSKSIVLKDAATENVIIFYYTRDVGGLSVTKNVALVGNATETVTDFYFDITVPSGVTGTYTYTVGAEHREVAVTDGKLTIYIQNGQTATFGDLPIGVYTVAEHNYADKGYSASYVDNSDTTTDGVVTVTKGGTATVECKNAFPVGSLTITKTVSKAYSGDEWSGDTFTFVISGTDGTSLVNGATYPVYKGTTEPDSVTVENGTLTVKISFTAEGTKAIKIDELPQGSYQIVESLSENQAKAYSTDPTDRTQTTSISPDDYAGDASFTNTLKRYVGDLKIEKVVNVTSGTAPDTTFIFTVKPAQGGSFDKTSYTVVYTDTQSGTVTENVVDGKLTLELKANEAVVIEGLPIGNYVVNEEPALGFAPSFDGGNTVSSEVNATVPKDGQASVVCTNRYPAYTGNLRIDKDVIKEYSRDTLPDHSFSITVTLTPDPNAVLVDRSYSYQIYDRNGNKVGDVVNGTIATGSTSATITVGLKDGQYVVITDLPTGGYSVTENLGDLANDYNTPTYEAQTGMIEADQMAQATVKNKYTQHLGTLTISKKVTGTNANDTFIFHIKGNGTNNSHIDMDVVINGSGEVKIFDLPFGTYTVTENTSWSWRYTISETTAQTQTVTLSSTNLDGEAEFTNNRTNDQWLSNTDVESNTFTATSNAD